MNGGGKLKAGTGKYLDTSIYQTILPVHHFSFDISFQCLKCVLYWPIKVYWIPFSQVGYIPANYVEKVTTHGLEKYE